MVDLGHSVSSNRKHVKFFTNRLQKNIFREFVKNFYKFEEKKLAPIAPSRKEVRGVVGGAAGRRFSWRCQDDSSGPL